MALNFLYFDHIPTFLMMQMSRYGKGYGATNTLMGGLNFHPHATRGSVSAPGVRRASFSTRAPPVTCLGGALSAVRAQCNYLDV